MAGSLADGAEIEVLKLLTGQATSGTGTLAAFTGVTLPNVYVALFTVSPSDSTLGTEATGGNYARVDSKTKWATPASGSVSTNAIVAFATFNGQVSSGSAFVAFGLLNHISTLTANTLIAWGALTDITKTGGNGDTVSFASGALTITCD